MNMRVFAFSSSSALVVTAAVVACGGSGGGGPTPSAPTAMVNIAGTTATPFPFNPGSPGVTVGTEGFVSIVDENIGSQDMVVSSVSYTPDSAGDRAITLSPGVALSTAPDQPASTPVTVPFNAALTVGLTCTPPMAGTYNGTVDIKSNASNLPDISIVLQCVGVDAGPT